MPSNKLTGQPKLAGITGYRVQARRGSGKYRTVKTVPGKHSTSTTIRGLKYGKYRFRVQAVGRSRVSPTRASWSTVRVRAHKRSTWYYTFRSARYPGFRDVTTLRVMSDGTVDAIHLTGLEYTVMSGHLSRGRITGKFFHYNSLHNWNQRKTGRWNTLRLRDHKLVRKSRSLSGHKNSRLFKGAVRDGRFPKA